MKPLVMRIDDAEAAVRVFRDLNVSRQGIEIMAPKAVHRVIRVCCLDARAANILKQEMLSKGGEAATPWEVFSMEAGSMDVILMGTLRQFELVCEKLKMQPFGLKRLAKEILDVLGNYEKKFERLEAGRFTLDLSAKTHVMGILNITPDSFSDGGRFFDPPVALEHARRMVEDGADILDVGGESTRPGAEPLSLDEELRRIIPVIETLAGEVGVPISVDTYKPEVARRALDAGAALINDISGLRDEGMVELAAETGAPVVVMHMKGTPRDMQKDPTYVDVVSEVADWLEAQARSAIERGVSPDRILIDPGIGFGKNREHNLELLKRLSELKSLGYPIVLGTSRKAFIGLTLDVPPDERVEGTIATVVHGITQGVSIVRVHDVKQAARACRMTDAVLGNAVSAT